MSTRARAAAELAARESYSRILAFLAARSGDLAAAEDALAEAFRLALETWPQRGVPDRPEAWICRTAQNRLIDEGRRATTRQLKSQFVELDAAIRRQDDASDPEPFPDDRLKLLFICSHPAISPSIRTPLMLQTVLGLDAKRIASAFLVSPRTMSQRLVRAKRKIALAKIPFQAPRRDQWPERLGPVLDSIYAAFGTAWDDDAGANVGSSCLAAEALWLGQLLVHLLPDAAEAKGLLALMLYCESRRAARRDGHGNYVPLESQDRSLWSHDLIGRAERLLVEAAADKQTGRYQLEAAIQSAHVNRLVSQRGGWREIAALYDLLMRVAPSVGAAVSRAAAIGEARGAESGLGALEELPGESVANYQPYWAVRGHLLAEDGRRSEALEALENAIGLSSDPAVRRHLQARRREIGTAI